MRSSHFRTISIVVLVAVLIVPSFDNGDAPASAQTDVASVYADPQWSPDGTQIAFVSSELSSVDIWVIGADGSNLFKLIPDNPSQEVSSRFNLSPRWSPDGNSIAYITAPDTPVFGQAFGDGFDLWVIGIDGSNAINLTMPTEAAIESFVWSPNGGSIAFSTFLAEKDIVSLAEAFGNGVDEENDETSKISGEVWVVDQNNSNLRRISPVSENNLVYANPTWSPDGQKIAFVATEMPLDVGSEEAEKYEIWMIDAKSELPPITVTVDNPVDNLMWSPDRTTILIGGRGISLFDVVAQTIANLSTPSQTYGTYLEATWSPDSRHIAFTYLFSIGDDLGSDIWLIESTLGAVPINLTQNGGQLDATPRWSPDGSKIAFLSNREDVANIWVMNSDGSNPMNLTGSLLPALQ